MDKNTIKTLKQRIEYILEKFPETRDSDIELTLRVWHEFYPDTTHQLVNESMRALFDLPSQDSIKRLRAYIQNGLKKYPPSTWAVAKVRGWQADVWKQALGYTVEHPDQLQFAGVP